MSRVAADPWRHLSHQTRACRLRVQVEASGAGSDWSPGVCGSTEAGGGDPNGVGAGGPPSSDEMMTSPMTAAVWQSSGCVGHCEGSITIVRDLHWVKLQPEALRQSPIRPVASFRRVHLMSAPSRAVAPVCPVDFNDSDSHTRCS